eukprot:1249190-Ditylum_brightwellii.AAC.1
MLTQAPWGVPAAFTEFQNEPFPSIHQLDDEYNSWPESINSLVYDKDLFDSGQTNTLGVVPKDKQNSDLDPVTDKCLVLQSGTQFDLPK